MHIITTVAAIAVAATLATAGSANAVVNSLNDNNDPNPGFEVTDGDKRFFNFLCISADQTDPSAAPGLCEFVSIVPLADPNQHGIDLIASDWVAGPGEAFDVNIRFDVEVTSAAAIETVIVEMDSTVTSTVVGVASISETVRIGGTNTIIGEIDLFNLAGTNTQTGSAPLDPVRQFLNIEKDIIFANFDTGGSTEVRITRIAQDFIQIPLPASLVLFAAGLAGLAVARRGRVAA